MTTPSRAMTDLLALMARLRDPEKGCAWDLEQDFVSLAPFALEEAAEVVDAIRRGDPVDLKEELGDLLLQVIFHARIAEEKGLFDFGGVVETLSAKLIRRHPHIFDTPEARSATEVDNQWARIKAWEKQERAKARAALGLAAEPDGLLAGIPASLPALARAVAVQKKAATVGFDWNDPRLVVAKLREELDELEEALASGDTSHMEEETGDVLFTIANLARHLAIDPDKALQGTNGKFIRRFGFIEQAIKAKGLAFVDASLEAMEDLWQQAKADEHDAGGSPPPVL